MDEDVIYLIKKYHRYIQEYKDSAPNEGKKLSWRLFSDILRLYFSRNPTPEKLKTFKDRALYKLYRKIEPSLLSRNEEELIEIFGRIEKIITNQRFRFSLLESKLAKKQNVR